MQEPQSKKEEKTPLANHDSPPLYYFRNCSEQTIQILEKKYNKTRDELEAIIQSHKIHYYTFSGLNRLSKLSNLAFTYTLLQFGNLAIDSCFEAIFAKPLKLGNYSTIITAPLALADLILFSLTFSSTETALKDTLQIVHLPSLKKFFKTNNSAWKKHMIEAAHFSACLIPLATYGIPRILAVKDVIASFNKAARLAIQIPLLFIGLNFAFRYFSYGEYRKNCGLLLHKLKNLHEVTGTNFYVCLQILLQYICLVGSNVYPLNYAQAILSEEALGWWFPASLVSILTGWQLTIATLPNIIRVYTGDDEIVLTNLKDHYHDDISRLLLQKENKDTHQDALNIVENQFGKKAKDFFENYSMDNMNEETLTKFIKIYREDKLYPEMTQHHSLFYIFKKDPILIFSSFLRVAVGMYTGYQLSQFQEKIPMVGCTFLIGVPVSSVLFYTMYKAERAVRTAKDLNEEKNTLIIKQPSTIKDKCIKGAIQTLNVSNVIITAMYVIATLALLIENSNSKTKNVGMIAILFIALESALYMMRYNIEKVNETVKQIKETYRSPFRFLSCNKNKVVEENVPMECINNVEDNSSFLRP